MDDTAAVTRVLAGFYRALSTLDVPSIVPYCHEPALFVAPAGVTAASTRADLATAVGTFTAGLRARGFGRSALDRLHMKPLSDTATYATGVAVRFATDGKELDRVGVTYVLHRGGPDWKIAVTVIHDVDTAPQPD